MTTWRIARRAMPCGYCGARILVGAIYATRTIGRAALVRCASCAGPAPTTVPDDATSSASAIREKLATRLGLLPFEREREPGEDD